MKRGFTLIEILVVLIVVGILAAIGLPNYSLIKEKALDREAKAILGLMGAAEKIYKMELGGYYESTIVSDINDNLRLSLPASSSWNYSVANTGVGTADRSGGTMPRSWTFDSASEVLDCDGTCF